MGRVLRVKLRQEQAHYRREESNKNKMTYPLPPYSTVIGAIHNACGYTEYRDMNISIQGKYQSMYRRPYTDYCYLNSIMDDRGILIKHPNKDSMSRAFTKVASAKKPQGNSFRKGITIDIHNQKLMDEYLGLKELGDELDAFNKERINRLKARVKVRKATLLKKKKIYDKKSDEYKQIDSRDKEIKALEKQVVARYKEYKEKYLTNELAKYGSLTTSLKYYEILTGVELVLHIEADEKILDEIEENIYGLRAIGRSEDFVEVEEAEMVEVEVTKRNKGSRYSAYLKKESIENGNIGLTSVGTDRGITASGTRYFLNKNYEIVKGKRVFKKVNVLYTSKYNLKRRGNGLVDVDGYIVDLV